MTKEEFIHQVCKNMHATEWELEEIGLQAVPCECGHSWCSGWKLQKQNDFEITKLHARFSPN
jgi:hypothetical protein